ncbi:MAG: cell division protein FtsA, partial [Moraxellaceae bacterium]
LTGGSAKIEGVIELAEEIFHMPVRLGIPQQITGLADSVKNPIYSTGVGLLFYGQRQQSENRFYQRDETKGSVISRVKKWVRGNF